MNIVAIIGIFIFSYLWTYFIQNLLPNNLSDVKSKQSSRYDERQKMMVTEIFAKSFVWLMYFILFSLLSRVVGLTNPDRSFLLKYPEIAIIVFSLVMIGIHYFIVKRKYTIKD